MSQLSIAKEMESYFDRLWPILRSITGSGVRETHRILSELVPLQMLEIPTGTPVFDWTVPEEWVVNAAYIIDPNGKRILDVKTNNLHLVNYSAPYRGKLTRQELDLHLHSIPELPSAIPYITSYYKQRWGFCIADEMRRTLPDGEYEVVVDTALIQGSLTISEAILPGESTDEVLISTYTCHPSLANNELSGPLVSAFLCRELLKRRRRLTFRFVFCPETIGTIAYLSMNGEHLKQRVKAGYLLTCVGDDGKFTYERSREASLADRAAQYVLKKRAKEHHQIRQFSPVGSDLRQYCSPGFNLPVGSLMRTTYGEYPQYHTSLDNKSTVSFEAMEQTVEICLEILSTLDKNTFYQNLNPYCEPQLGKRGLYPTLSTGHCNKQTEALLWLLNYSDGKHDLLQIAEMSGLEIDLLHDAAASCQNAKLISEAETKALL